MPRGRGVSSPDKREKATEKIEGIEYAGTHSDDFESNCKQNAKENVMDKAIDHLIHFNHTSILRCFSIVS